MARVWVGNFKGPKGDKGDQGDMGPQGPEGKQGPVGLVNADAAIEFEDYTAEGAEVPTTEEALSEIISGKSLKSIISNIRAFFKGVVTLGMIVNNLDDVMAVEEGTVLPVGCKAFQDLSAKIHKISIVECRVNAEENKVVVLKDALVSGNIPGPNAIPIVFGHWKANNAFENIYIGDASGKWMIYSNVTQQVRIRFYVID